MFLRISKSNDRGTNPSQHCIALITITTIIIIGIIKQVVAYSVQTDSVVCLHFCVVMPLRRVYPFTLLSMAAYRQVHFEVVKNQMLKQNKERKKNKKQIVFLVALNLFFFLEWLFGGVLFLYLLFLALLPIFNCLCFFSPCTFLLGVVVVLLPNCICTCFVRCAYVCVESIFLCLIGYVCCCYCRCWLVFFLFSIINN